MNQTERDQFRAACQRDLAARRAARLQEVRDTVRWRNVGHDRWTAATPLGTAYCYRRDDRRWIAGFDVRDGKPQPFDSLDAAKEALIQHLVDHPGATS